MVCVMFAGPIQKWQSLPVPMQEEEQKLLGE